LRGLVGKPVVDCVAAASDCFIFITAGLLTV
jgi:hypothetical protein